MYLHLQHANHGKMGFVLQNFMTDTFAKTVSSIIQGHVLLVKCYCKLDMI